MAIFLLFIGGSILTFGDIFMKKWVDTDILKYLIIGFIGYMIGMMFLVATFKSKNIAVASVIFILFNIFTLALVSHFYFKEPLSSWQIVGLLVGLLSVVILELSE